MPNRTALAVAREETTHLKYQEVLANPTDASLKGLLDGVAPESQFIISKSLGEIRGAIAMVFKDNQKTHQRVIGAIGIGINLRTIEMSEEERAKIAAISTIVRDTYTKIAGDVEARNIIEDMRDVERALLQPPRIAIVGDRELENLRTALDEANSDEPKLDMAGIITPGFELDPEILRLLDLLPDIKKRGIATMIEREDLPHGQDMQIDAPYRHIRYAHAPYDIDKLKTEPGYRKQYCLELLDHLRRMAPDWILLANFKLVLDRVMTAEFPDRIVNIHPAVLPLNKGYRTEKLADPFMGNTNPDALGYTIHLVSENLDGGPTLFQQRVNPDPFNEDDIEDFGSREAFDRYREECLRLKVIRAESKYSAKVMGIVASNTPRKTLIDSEAFASEGRAGFEKTDAYLKSLEADFEHFKKSDTSYRDLAYEDWFNNHRQPYQRVLFEHEGRFETLEKILGAEEIAPEKTHAPLTRYTFTLRGKSHAALWKKYANEILKTVEGTGKLDHQIAFASTDTDGKPCLVCSIFTTKSMDKILQPFGIDFKARTMAVGVNAQRRSPYVD